MEDPQDPQEPQEADQEAAPVQTDNRPRDEDGEQDVDQSEDAVEE